MAQLIKMAGTVRSVNGVEPDENANVTIQQVNILQAYPVGSIYMSVVETNPAELFGGTWEAMPGRVLIGAGVSDFDINYVAGTRGGSRSRTLTSSNIPKHTHTVEIKDTAATHNHRNGVYDEVPAGSGPLSTNYGAIKMYPTATQHVMAADGSAYGTNTQLYMGYTSETSAVHTHEVTVGYYGAKNPTEISVMQPYLVVYMWKRTA